MISAVAVQSAIRARLTGAAGVAALVPAAHILDRHKRPAPLPSIVIGEGQDLDDGSDVGRQRVRHFHDLHIWTQEPSFEVAATIAAEVHKALHGPRLDLAPPFHCADLRLAATRRLRDPSGDLSHLVVTVETLVHWVPE